MLNLLELQELINKKWSRYGKPVIFRNGLLNLFYAILTTFMGKSAVSLPSSDMSPD
jgi:hypothetical protein